MKPLISIETVPISIEYTTVKAETRPRAQSGGVDSAKLNISKGGNQLTISSNPINIQLQDKFENVGSSMAYTATAAYSKDGVLSMNVRIQSGPDGSDGGGLRFKAAGQGIDRMVDSLPKATGDPLVGMRINFDMGKIPDAPKISSEEVETSFIPPDIQVEIKEHPKVIIKYVGGPIYFPRSADPNYEPAVNDGKFHIEA